MLNNISLLSAGFLLLAFFISFVLCGLLFSNIRAIRGLYVKALRALCKVIFFFDFRELISHQALGSVLGRGYALGFKYHGKVKLGILFFGYIDQFHQEAPVLHKIISVDEFLVGITD